MSWFVLNARDAEWIDCDLGKFCNFEPEGGRFEELGINLNVLAPGEPMTMYHREYEQEDFLVLDGDCLLIVEGEEHPMKQWDLFHCPPGIAHAIVGAGDRPSVALAVGARGGDDRTVYPADPVAQKHGAGVTAETTSAKEAYAGYTFPRGPYQEGWLPE
ncbi:MAG: cupin domain-containing protein [Gaiellaceae bacterium]